MPYWARYIKPFYILVLFCILENSSSYIPYLYLLTCISSIHLMFSFQCVSFIIILLAQKESRCSSRSGSICVSVRDALGAFDFLDTEETEEGGETNQYVPIFI